MKVITQRLKQMEQDMDDDHNYGGWLIEDLKEHYKYLMEKRDHSELYSDRTELNKLMLKIVGEIQSRERN